MKPRGDCRFKESSGVKTLLNQAVIKEKDEGEHEKALIIFSVSLNLDGFFLLVGHFPGAPYTRAKSCRFPQLNTKGREG
jgi:hypothetical protein